MTDPTVRWSAAARRAVDRQRAAASHASTGATLIELHRGDPCFPTPPLIAAAADAAVREGYTHYPPVLGDPELRARIAGDLTARSGRRFDAAQVIVTVGAIGALAGVLQGYLDEGDEAIVFDPSYSGYAPLIRQAGATVVRVPLRPPQFRLDLSALQRRISPRTKLIVLANPANPTGTVLSADELRAIADVVLSRDLLLVVDEVYDHLVFGETPFTSALQVPDVADRLLYINSFSKTYAMTGWRVGYLAAPLDLVGAPATLVANTVNGVSWPAQRAALAAFECGEDVAAMMRGYAERRAAIIDALRAAGDIDFTEPLGAFYVFPRFPGLADVSSEQLTDALRGAGLAVRSGSEFGPAGEGYLRLSFSAQIDDIYRGVRILSTVVRETSGSRARHAAVHVPKPD